MVGEPGLSSVDTVVSVDATKTVITLNTNAKKEKRGRWEKIGKREWIV
jgi:hypothetical protein